jgi:hypothetical protein
VEHLDPIVADRLRRVLLFIAVGGGAALVSTRERAVVASVGELHEVAAMRALDVNIEPNEAVVHVAPEGLVAAVGRHHRLYAEVPAALPNPAFADRMRRARDLIVRFGLHVGGHAPPGTPPGSAPAHAAVFAPRRQRRS